jgi:ring-1,2-phenylacetyl-CoA epoxidase subunit PaaD
VLAIELAVGAALEAAGIAARIERVLAPPWTTDWITPEGREKLRTAGIAPPVTGSGALFTQTVVPCPRCGATSTEKLGDFGSTPCKAPWRCTACAEPFEHFKCL